MHGAPADRGVGAPGVGVAGLLGAAQRGALGGALSLGAAHGVQGLAVGEGRVGEVLPDGVGLQAGRQRQVGAEAGDARRKRAQVPPPPAGGGGAYSEALKPGFPLLPPCRSCLSSPKTAVSSGGKPAPR